MEVLIPLLVLVALVLLFRTFGSRRKQHVTPEQVTPGCAPLPPIRPTQTPPSKPRVFDEKSARHLTQPRVLSGPAYVADGDTIRIGKTQVRLFGIDAPELNHPYGKKAKWALHGLCKGQIIRAEITEEDEYGRTVARCFLEDGRDLSAEMVKLGLAIDWPKFSGGCYRPFEVPDVRKKLFLANARQKGRMHVWDRFEARQADR